jgi:hypothetical protein
MLLIGTVGTYFNGCQGIPQRDQQSELQLDQQSPTTSRNQQLQQNQNGEQGDQDAELDEPENNTTAETKNNQYKKIARKHPKEATAWFTRRLLMTSPQPSATRINECRGRVESSAASAPNFRELDEAVVVLETSVSKNENLYHWCFYQMMADLDLKLDSTASLMDEKGEIFLSRMRSLWVMARALDELNQSEVYMKYLRVRYTEISQTVFGRNLEVIDPNGFSLPTVGAGKAAARFEE